MDGSGGYKGKAEGSNSSEGLWIANLTGEPLDKASEIVWFESAYDAMAEYQINPVKMVYVSTGGTPARRQCEDFCPLLPTHGTIWVLTRTMQGGSLLQTSGRWLCRVYRSRQGRETKGKRRKEHIS